MTFHSCQPVGSWGGLDRFGAGESDRDFETSLGTNKESILTPPEGPPGGRVGLGLLREVVFSLSPLQFKSGFKIPVIDVGIMVLLIAI